MNQLDVSLDLFWSHLIPNCLIQLICTRSMNRFFNQNCIHSLSLATQTYSSNKFSHINRYRSKTSSCWIQSESFSPALDRSLICHSLNYTYHCVYLAILWNNNINGDYCDEPYAKWEVLVSLSLRCIVWFDCLLSVCVWVYL